jgi:hypothetical protein
VIVLFGASVAATALVQGFVLEIVAYLRALLEAVVAILICLLVARMSGSADGVSLKTGEDPMNFALYMIGVLIVVGGLAWCESAGHQHDLDRDRSRCPEVSKDHGRVVKQARRRIAMTQADPWCVSICATAQETLDGG